MRAVKKSTGLWAFLEQAGKIGASGDELAQLKKIYRRQYEAQYKRDRKITHEQFCVSFTRSEAKKLSRASLEHGMKDVEFIKKAVWGYLNGIFVVQHRETVDRILQALLRYQTAILRAEDGEKGKWFKPDRNFRELERSIVDIQREVRDALMNPPKLADLVRQALIENPHFQETLQAILSEHDT